MKEWPPPIKLNGETEYIEFICINGYFYPFIYGIQIN